MNNSLLRHTVICLVTGAIISSFCAASHAQQPVNPEPSLPEPSQWIKVPGETTLRLPDTDTETASFSTLALHYQRYSQSANNVLQLFAQSRQQWQKTVQIADALARSPNNQEVRQQLLNHIRQSETTQVSSNAHYQRLQNQMQHENRNYLAVAMKLKERYETPDSDHSATAHKKTSQPDKAKR